jgi:hypothetical protein
MGSSKHERKYNWKETVAASVKRELDEHRKSDAWLQEAERFSHNLLLSPEKQAIAKRLFHDLIGSQGGYKRPQKELDFEVLCANLLYHKRRRPVAISFNSNHWIRSRYRRASSFTIERATDMLSRNGLIEMKKGYGHEKKSLAQRTKIWPTTKLLEAFEPVGREDCIFDRVELVELRDENKRPIDYKDTEETERVRENLRKVNLVTDRALVQYVEPNSSLAYRLHTRLYAIYNIDFKHGGRLYTAERDGYQFAVTREERKFIQIDGEPTVELDFSGFHPRLLYAWEGIQYNDDPYSLGVGGPQLRPIVKELFFYMVNSDSEVTAVRAGNKLLKDKRGYYHLLRRRGLKVKGDLVPMIKEAHEPISEYFCTNAGLRVMNLDAKIALDVIAHFANDDIPVLAIHDSFIVPRQYKHPLRKAMRLAYKKQTGGFRCPTK